MERGFPRGLNAQKVLWEHWVAKRNGHRQGGVFDGGRNRQERQNRNAKRECSLISVGKFQFALLPRGGSQKDIQ